jgi:hypothetical protein
MAASAIALTASNTDKTTIAIFNFFDIYKHPPSQ